MALIKYTTAGTPQSIRTVMQNYSLNAKANYKRIAQHFANFCLDNSLALNEIALNTYLTTQKQAGRKSLHSIKTPCKDFLRFCIANKISHITLGNEIAQSNRIEASFENLVSAYLAQIDTNKEATMRSYKIALKSYTSYLSKNNELLSYKSVLEFRNIQESEYTSNLYLSTIKGFCLWLGSNLALFGSMGKAQSEALKNELNKIDTVKSLKTSKEICKGVLTTIEIDVILGRCRDEREALVLALLAYAGLRTIEVERLSLNDISIEGNYIRVQGKGQNSKASKVPILAKVKPYLEKAIKAGIEPSIKTSNIRSLVNRHLTQNNLKMKDGYKVSAHSFRHSLAVNLLGVGIPINQVKNVLRHANLNTTEIYLKHLESIEMMNNEQLINSL
jgi:integrase/recombinase XerC